MEHTEGSLPQLSSWDASGSQEEMPQDMEAGATANYITVQYLFPSNSSHCEQLFTAVFFHCHLILDHHSPFHAVLVVTGEMKSFCAFRFVTDPEFCLLKS